MIEGDGFREQTKCSRQLPSHTIICLMIQGDNQTVMGKMSSSYCIIIHAMKSPQSVHFYDVVISFLCYFVDLEFSIKNKKIFLKICFNETPKVKTNESMIISMVRAFYPINNWIYIFTRLEITIRLRRQHFEYIDYHCMTQT